MTKMLAFFEKFITPYTLIALNLVLILCFEFVGDGTYFAETGLVHAIALIFVALIIVRIFSEYAFSDRILRGFLNIQLTFFLFLGLVHVYEYFGEYFFMMREDVVQLTVMASYFAWLLSVFLALGYVFRIYYKQSALAIVALWSLFGVCLVGLVAPSVSDTVVAWFPLWFPKLILTGIVVFGIAGIFATRKLRQIMPVFTEYSYYLTPASLLLILAAFSEYLESAKIVNEFGVSQAQNLYFSHILLYASLSILFVGFGKLKKPRGIYEA